MNEKNFVPPILFILFPTEPPAYAGFFKDFPVEPLCIPGYHENSGGNSIYCNIPIPLYLFEEISVLTRAFLSRLLHPSAGNCIACDPDTYWFFIFFVFGMCLLCGFRVCARNWRSMHTYFVCMHTSSVAYIRRNDVTRFLILLVISQPWRWWPHPRVSDIIE